MELETAVSAFEAWNLNDERDLVERAKHDRAAFAHGQHRRRRNRNGSH